jgi:AcrR family transcriptional regulator
VPKRGLDLSIITEAGAAVADEVGFANLSMGLVAERLGVTPPSLYKHVENLADLAHRIAVVAATELADALRDATQGVSGGEALTAAAWTMRKYIREHPGRYAAGNDIRPTGPQDPLVAARDRMVVSLAAVLHGYRMDASQKIHALRLLRSLLHGFATLEVADGFQFDVESDDSFTWIIDFLNRGLQATTPTRPHSDPLILTRRWPEP